MTADFKLKIKAYYRLTKPGIIYGNVLSGLAGYLFASRLHIHLLHFICLILGMSLVIGSACVFNNVLDKKIDAKMARTKKRALVTGLISSKSALIYGTVLGLLGFIILAKTNLITWLSGLVAIIFYVLVYGYFKRRSIYGTLVGTIPGSASLVAGYTAYTDKLNYQALLLFLIMVAWQMAHFYSISIYRLKEYKAAKIPLWPIKVSVQSTVFQIKLYVLLFAAINVLLAIAIDKTLYGILLLLISFYWAQYAFSDWHKETAVWAKKVFFRSLFSLLLWCLVLSTVRFY
jgi:protoheme IX farnesyltransferase